MTGRYLRRTPADRSRPRVIDVAPAPRHESGPRRGADWTPGRVAVLAHWSEDPVPSRSVLTMLQELDAAGFETVLASAAPFDVPLVRLGGAGEPGMPDATTVLRRENVGYDFGTWASVLDAFPGVRRADRVLLVNDSLIGPFASLAPVLARSDATTSPVWGLSGSLQHRPHLQSFFTGYRQGVLDAEPLRAFWQEVRVERRKSLVIRYCELGLSEVLDEAGIAFATLVRPQEGDQANSSLEGWLRLLGPRFPFVKRQVLQRARSERERELVWEAVESTFGAHLGEWLEHESVGPPAGSSRWARAAERIRWTRDIEGASGLLPWRPRP